jgi:3-methyladenine DNA glycosylase AlkC
MEPFKNKFNQALIVNMAEHFQKVWAPFDKAGFCAHALKDFEKLELKQRSAQITEATLRYLPDDFDKAAYIILQSVPQKTREEDEKIILEGLSDQGIRGWAIMPLADYIGQNGLKSFDLSMKVLKELTKWFSAEFGIRYLLKEEPARVIAVLRTWLKEDNHHVRRLISEGTRPRLPWGIGLPEFTRDPALLLPLLEVLKDDKQEYVRRSVANHLNDIAKDHPDLVAKITVKWLKGADKNRERLIKHACRTLIKKGHQRTLKALGYSEPKISLKKFNILTPKVQFGEALLFEMEISSDSDISQNLIIDYALHHMKANGKLSPKVFKWKQSTLTKGKSISAHKKHALRPITTRKYYAGKHRVEIFINGKSFGCKDFDLEI